MKRILFILLFLFGILLPHSTTFAQEIENENSAEFFLEEYSDAFQEKFFEALKQKGIENYDKAINLLLDCKRIDADKKVVDFELSKVYRESKELELAQEYALYALRSDPENFWYLHNLVIILNLKGSGITEVEAEIPSNNTILKQNLALIYYQLENYKSAINVLKTLKTSTFTENLNSKLKSGVKKVEENTETYTINTTVNNNPTNSEIGTIDHYKINIDSILRSKNFLILDGVSKEALDNYPAQPYFYYARGLALNAKKSYKEAIVVLEESLDYMLDDIGLANKIYKELSVAYLGLHNTVKSNAYLKKIKPGF